ncbi:uncharacterized protein LOC114350227 [Ostrinia furnacalis]|uniref:uncharacterized protein LOC114350227 n=1 Tax=Ostrinia furnacalis TaxID=93504 RepID=UPI00103D8A6C|nr:uncharacterized protein LOC114350227 [Ostrinia furnacalis]
MYRFILLLVSLNLGTTLCASESSPENVIDSAKLYPSTPEPEHASQIIENTISNLESVAAMAAKLTREGILPTEETEKHYDHMIETLAELIEMVKDQNNAYKFHKAKGIDRIIFHNMDIPYSRLRGPLLVLLKVLFEVVPTTTDAFIPISTIDKLLDIFENDDNLAMKAHALDILYIWLPENPKAQVRVMKLKGLEPFYHQVSKLDTSVISILLDLFNTILEEHIKVRNVDKQMTKADSDKIQLYRRIGLLERMSTPAVCNGLMKIFENTWSYVTDDNDVIGPVLDLVKNIKPYCMKVLRGQTKATELFQAILDYVQDGNKKEYLENLNVNITDMKTVLEDFIRELKYTVKDEF